MLQVVFTGPGDFDRDPDRLTDLDGFGDEIRSAAPSKSAAKIERVDLHLRERQAGDLLRHRHRRGLNLGRGPHIAGIGTHVNRAIERLHRRVGQVGSFINCFDFLRAQSAASVSPRFFATAPGFSARSENICRMLALEVLARRPSSNTTLSALRP